MFAPTDVCGVIKGCEINNNAKCQWGWAVEGASPYNSEITASPEHGRTMFAPTDVCGIIKGCEINNNAKCQRGVGGADFVLQYGVCLIYGSRVLFTL